MVVTLQVYDEVLQTGLLVISDNRLNIQFSRSHLLKTVCQYIQTVTIMDRFHETYASVTTIDIHIRGLIFLTLDKSGVGEAYHILTIVETRMRFSCV